MSANIQDLTPKKKMSKAEGLLHSLVPRAQCFCFYDNDGHCVWSSDGVDDHEIDNFVTDLPEDLVQKIIERDDVIRRTLASGRTALALPAYGDGDGEQRLGMLVALFSRNAGKSSWFNPSLLKSILEPALDVIGQSLSVDRELAAAQDHARDVEKELKLVYEVDEKIHGAKTRHSSLGQLVGQSGRFLGINYSVLLIPSKRIRISATHANWKNVKRKVLDRYLIEQLLPKLEGQRTPVIFQIPAVEGSDEPAEHGYQALLSPLLDGRGNVEGILAQLGRVDNSEFSPRDIRFMTHIVRKVEYVIERTFDSMTGFMNRIGFEDQLRESWKALSAAEDRHQLIYFDLDNLQLVNDRFGRDAGDEVILHFARLLEKGLPKTGVLSRLTGDDFCMILTHADTEAAFEYAQRVRSRGKSLRYLDGDISLQVTMSIGVAEFSQASGDIRNALTTARMACEAATDHGGDRIEVYDAGDQSMLRRYDDMQLVAEIQQALDGAGFELHAQPIVSLTDDEDTPRFEVLLRMSGADGEYVPTKALFSAAERYRMMPQIDRWVVSEAIARLLDIQALAAGRGASFSINLSGQSLGDDEFLSFIEEELEHSGISASSVTFEITESAAVSNLKKAQGFINRLRELGCKISLDDFGTGLSSFAYLKDFNVDTLKIDGGFILDIEDNQISESMVAAITQVARVMGLETVAEYVETEAAREQVIALGVDFAQGHAIGKPTAIEALLCDLSDRTRSSAG